MHAFFKAFAFGGCVTLATLGTVAANAQNSYSDQVYQGAVQAAHPSGTESIGQSTAAPAMNSTISSDDVYQGAMSAARPVGTESIGQSTSPPMPSSSLSREEVYRGAVAAAHAGGTEVIGQSTGMAAVTGGTPH
jgi:predicted membrane protein